MPRPHRRSGGFGVDQNRRPTDRDKTERRACLRGVAFDEFDALVDERLLRLQMLLNNQVGRI